MKLSPSRAGLGLALAGLLALSTSCGDSDTPAPAMNVLLVTVDTTRADALDPRGPHAQLSPNLGRLANEGVYFSNARTVAPITLPAHSSMMTGLIPPRHSVRLNGTQSLPNEALTLAELAQEHGFQTSAFIAAVVLNAEYGLNQGFDTYDEIGSVAVDKSVHYAERPANEVVDATLEWMRTRDKSRRFFSWVHLFDAHMPYQPPAEHVRAAGGDLYLGEVSFLDRELGRLFDALRADGQWENTVVLVVADHGEARGEHDESTHGTFGFDGTLKVPFFLRDPHGNRRGVSNAPVSVVDVFPTLARAFGSKSIVDVDGIDLAAGDPPAGRGVYFESYFGTHSYGWAPLVGWIKNDWKLVQSSASELYHLSADPRELTNRIADPATDARVRELRRDLAQALELDSLNAQSAQTDPEVMKSLQGLGYVGMEQEAGDFPSPFAETNKPSPHSQIQNLRDFQEASTFSASERHAEAIALLEPLVERAPTNGAAWRVLASSYINAYRYEDGLRAAFRNLETQGDWWGANVNIGAAYDGLKQHDKTIEFYKKAVDQNVDLDTVLSRLGGLLLERPTDEEKREGLRYLSILRENLIRRGQWPIEGSPTDGSAK